MNAQLPDRGRKQQQSKHFGDCMPCLDVIRNPALNKEIRKYVYAQDEIQESTINDPWLAMPEIPTAQDMAAGVIRLHPNKIQGAYKSTERYLETHYTLLREDAIGSLREAIQQFRRDPATKDTPTFCVYEKVYFRGYTFTRKGIAAKVSFGMGRSEKRVQWSTSKRLVSGSLVALIRAQDKQMAFENMILAIVAARPVSALNQTPPMIDLFFGRDEDLQIDPQEEWIMLDAKQGYYEAHRYALRALQKLCKESFPFSNQICGLSQNRAAPPYVQANPIMDIAPVLQTEKGDESIKINVLEPWPATLCGTLDSSQTDALREMITQRLAIVQGPPGTGKTFLSNIALEILHKSQRPGDPPIIIAAQTNHALDQLLELVSRFEPDFIRLGGRSTHPEVVKRTLFNVKMGERFNPVKGSLLGPAMTQYHKQTKVIQKTLEPLSKQGSDPFATDLHQGTVTLRLLSVLTPNQANSLQSAAAQWISTRALGQNPFRLWLDQALVPFKVTYEQDHFGFNATEDEEVEFELLRETEDSTGINDLEDLELLQGPFTPLEDKYSVRPATQIELQRAIELLEREEDLWNVPEPLRGPMYSIIRSKALAAMLENFRSQAKAYRSNTKDLLIGKWENEATYLSRARIIGMTTTGLSKYRPLVASLKPRTILIEEAAEILEGPVTVACLESLEHLILVGDHLQLQGHCSVQDLVREPFFLEYSLFERLVKNNMPYKYLLLQRRMEPEFRALIQDIYPELSDHESVITRQRVCWGMGSLNSFYFDHKWSEYRDDSQSIYNPEEAKMIAGFYRYLLKNGVPDTNVTILTFYNGQRRRLLREICQAFSQPIHFRPKVKTIDSYQGEENSIIILSLARSNDKNSIGFLDNAHRVCVALSRAKYGFYMFGNSELLASQSTLWANVTLKMSRNPCRLGDALPIKCQKHAVITRMQYPEQWENNEGGCSADCDELLECGHKCKLKCHPYSHELVTCTAPCNKKLVCGHSCQKQCPDACQCRCKDYGLLLAKTTPSSIRAANPYSHAAQGSTDASTAAFTAQPRPISTDERMARFGSWKAFADGGVKEDDMRRDMHALTIASPSQSPSTARGGGRFVRAQTSSPMKNGKTRYVEEYCASGFDEVGGSTKGKEEEEEVNLIDL